MTGVCDKINPIDSFYDNSSAPNDNRVEHIAEYTGIPNTIAMYTQHARLDIYAVGKASSVEPTPKLNTTKKRLGYIKERMKGERKESVRCYEDGVRDEASNHDNDPVDGKRQTQFPEQLSAP